MEIENTPIQINMTTIQMELINDASAVSCVSDMSETKTDGPELTDKSILSPSVKHESR